jgi:16S rRNA (adenine1518-N6/adenine1519-N6)-dimethyltransferase
VRCQKRSRTLTHDRREVIRSGAGERPRVTHTRAAIHRLLQEHGLAPGRALGQNFVADPGTVHRVARLADVGAGDRVIEVGAGLGSLTLALAATGASVTAVEIDRHLIPVLERVLAGTGVRVVHGDALHLDWDALLGAEHGWVLVANLPYNIATPLVLDLLDHVPQIDRMLVMVQREAGERLVAGAGDAAYGIPSVKVAYHATGRIVGKVAPSVFVPRPRVESVLVDLRRRPAPAVSADPDVLFALVRAAFGQRRKMLRRALADVVDADDLEAAGIDPTARAETLDLAAWGRLADRVAAVRDADATREPPDRGQ